MSAVTTTERNVRPVYSAKTPLMPFRRGLADEGGQETGDERPEVVDAVDDAEGNRRTARVGELLDPREQSRLKHAEPGCDDHKAQRSEQERG